MNEPTLVLLAAGMGSRFGGLKQITPVDDKGHAIIDYSLYDAYRAGFKKVAFIIKHEIEDDFKEAIGHRIEKYFDVKYVYQQLDVLPEGYSIPEGRVKPWGTGHAVMCCRGVIDGPFAVLNSDDFYGPSAYKYLYDFMTAGYKDNEHAMIAYLLKNTVTENGYVARGVCSGCDGYLTDVVERTHIEKCGTDAKYTEDGSTWHHLDGDTLVSMNCWAFGNSLLEELYNRFPVWLDENLKINPLKCEFFLPFVVNECIKDNSASVHLLNCSEKWYGMTYKEDAESVKLALKNMRDQGIYPEEFLN